MVAFIYLSIVACAAGLATISLRNPIHCALGLVVVVFHVAGMFVLLGNGFLAAVQVIVYAGAIIVLFLFTIMLLDLRAQAHERSVHYKQIWLAIPVVILLFAEIGWIAVSKPEIAASLKGAYPPSRVNELGGSAQAIAQALFNEFLLPFEVASVLLLVAAVGALVLARRPDEATMGPMLDMAVDAAGAGPNGEPAEAAGAPPAASAHR